MQLEAVRYDMTRASERATYFLVTIHNALVKLTPLNIIIASAMDVAAI
jgi:hypothetical protein